jgi:predicted nucleic acid-binding protein
VNGYLLDSDVIIWRLRGNPEVLTLLRDLAERQRLCCSVVSVLEVEAGMRKGEERRTAAFLDALLDLPVNKAVARRAAGYLREFRPKGVTLDFADCLIAATAGLNDLVLVTKNVTHYPMEDVQLHAGGAAGERSSGD